MCGIIGIHSNNINRELFNKALESINHRGPDSEGLWTDGSAAFGFRRLSIIDLTPTGNQPMISEDKNLVLIFNGEIYNFKELRTELISKNHVFRSTSDTEVILHAYQEWGTEAFARFNGMFALAIHDQLKNQIILARDHAGIKPLYYSIQNGELFFGSEIRLFKAYYPNSKNFTDWPIYFLTFGFIPAPYTTLDGVYMLPKGTYLSYDLSALEPAIKYRINTFHEFVFTHTVNSEKDANDLVRETFFAAVNRHMFSDAPLGIFLSGGIDSSLIALMADYLGHPDLNTLSVTFNEATYNEESYQQLVLNKMRKHNHQSYKVDYKLFIDNLDDVFKAMDQPSWDAVNSYFVSKCAHEAGLKAVLSGLGGDELFGGYPSFNRINKLQIARKTPEWLAHWAVNIPYSHLSRLGAFENNSNYSDYLFLRGGYNQKMVAQLLNISPIEVVTALNKLHIDYYPKVVDKNLASFLETNVYMEQQLLKDSDYMGMWHSLEVRVPFLDKDLMTVIHSISPSVKFQNKQPKYLLTKAFEDILPPEIIFCEKQGFTFPFDTWLRNNINHFEPLLPHTKATQPLLDQFLQGNLHWSRIWALIVLKNKYYS